MNRRRRRVNKHPISITSIWSMGLGIVSGLLFAMCVWISYIGAGKIGKITIGFATIGIVMAVVGTVIGYREFSETDYFSFTKLFTLVLPGLALALWLMIYIYGIFVL